MDRYETQDLIDSLTRAVRDRAELQYNCNTYDATAFTLGYMVTSLAAVINKLPARSRKAALENIAGTLKYVQEELTNLRNKA